MEEERKKTNGIKWEKRKTNRKTKETNKGKSGKQMENKGKANGKQMENKWENREETSSYWVRNLRLTMRTTTVKRQLKMP